MNENSLQSKVVIFVYYRTCCTTKELTEFGGTQSEVTKKTRLYGNPIVELLELCRQPTTQKIWRTGLWWLTTLKDAIWYMISARGWASPHNKHGYPTNRCCHWNPFKNGDWISWGHSSLQQYALVTSILSSQTIIAQNG
mgnify:CR=1 FL=1